MRFQLSPSQHNARHAVLEAARAGNAALLLGASGKGMISVDQQQAARHLHARTV